VKNAITAQYYKNYKACSTYKTFDIPVWRVFSFINRLLNFILLNMKKKFQMIYFFGGVRVCMNKLNLFVVFFLLGDSQAFKFYVLTFWNTPPVPSSYAEYLHHLLRWNSVAKHRHIKFKRRGITQKKEHNMAKVCNQENLNPPIWILGLPHIKVGTSFWSQRVNL